MLWPRKIKLLLFLWSFYISVEMAGWQGVGGQEMCYEQQASNMNKTISASGEQEEDMRENNCAVVMGFGGGGWGASLDWIMRNDLTKELIFSLKNLSSEIF